MPFLAKPELEHYSVCLRAQIHKLRLWQWEKGRGDEYKRSRK